MAFRDTEQLLIAFKARFGIQHTAMSNRDWFSESFGIKTPVYSEDVWLQFPASTNKYSYHDNNATLDAAIMRKRTWTGTTWLSVASGGTIPIEKVIMPLTVLTSTNYQAWMAMKIPTGLIDPDSVTATLRLMDGINFTPYGSDFLPRIYWDNGAGTAPGTEITTVALENGWLFDTASGVLLMGAALDDTFTPTGNLPIWVSWYRYIGTKGAGGGSALPILSAAFTFADLASGSMIIGDTVVPSTLSECVVNITTPFTAGTEFTLGDFGDADWLMTVDDTESEVIGMYEKFINTPIVHSSELKLYVVGPAPQAGAGSVLIYFK